MSTRPPSPELDAILTDRYRIERQLGPGGMATVFLAEDLRHNRQVAIKVLKPELPAMIGAESSRAAGRMPTRADPLEVTRRSDLPLMELSR